MLQEEALLRQAKIELERASQVMSNLGMQVDPEELAQLSEQQRLDFVRFLGLPQDLRDQIAEETSMSNLLPVVSSIDGRITDRHLVQGEVISPAQMLFQIVDTSSVWLRCDVALEDAQLLRLGQKIQFKPDGNPLSIPGQISWISTDVDPETRTVEIRSELLNPDGKLRNNTFGIGEIVLRNASRAVLVPESAVQWDGSCFVVFVRDKDYFQEDGPKLFYTRSVRTGVTQNGMTEIIAGLIPGEVVASEGSGVLRSQILKNNLGAGCTCGH